MVVAAPKSGSDAASGVSEPSARFSSTVLPSARRTIAV
jgi:hypothetical protein